jgi:hypothetical protein
VSIEKPMRTVSFGPFFFIPVFVCGPLTHAIITAVATTVLAKIIFVRIKLIPSIVSGLSDLIASLSE